ncbi:MAG: hypothetical protein QOI39_1537 [Mycobacterium sp.]|nr:hypothetical protein [Mycobacterium sp.]
MLLDAWQPHGAIWLPFGPLAPVAPVLPGLPLVPKSPLRVAGRSMTRRHHISHPRLVAACARFSGCVVRPSIGSAAKVPTRAPAATRCTCSGMPTPTKRRVPPPTRRWPDGRPQRRQRGTASAVPVSRVGQISKETLGYRSPADQMAVWRQGRLEQIGAPALPPRTNG